MVLVSGRFQILYAKLKIARPAVGKVVLQGVAHRTEGEFIPRNILFFKQLDFQAFDTGREIQIEQFCAIQ